MSLTLVVNDNDIIYYIYSATFNKNACELIAEILFLGHLHFQ